MPKYRIVDVLNDVAEAKPIIVDAPSPELAAQQALGISLTRSGAGRNLRARVYSHREGEAMSMVRLYGRVADEAQS